MEWHGRNGHKFAEGEFEAVLSSMQFELYEAGFGGSATIGALIQTVFLDSRGQIVFTGVSPGWYAVVETVTGIAAGHFKGAPPLYIYVGAGSVMSSLQKADVEGIFRVQYTEARALPIEILFDNGESVFGRKPDGSEQMLQTEKFEVIMPDGKWVLSFCADLGAQNVKGNYVFDETNHNFSDDKLLYLVATLDYINERYGGLDSLIGRALAQIVVWNLILKVDGNAGFAERLVQ
jgi:hypothetical protein